MKNILKKIMVVSILVFAMNFTSTNVANAQASVSFSLFYNSLAPYGGWVDDPSYGYVWVPDVGPSFRPYYSGGHWAMTSYGNMWVSDYAWGWAPFHYGRWIYDGYYGWVWVPDNVWGPAWVSWRWGGGYAGWAPLGPGVSLSIAFGNYSPPYDWWVFVPPTYMYSPVFYRYYDGPASNVTYINRTTIVNNTYVNGGTTYVAGPSATEVERATNQRVAVYDVKQGTKPSQSGISGNNVNVYRPDVQRTSGKSVAPANFEKAQRSIGKMEAISSNDGKPERLSRSSENKSSPEISPKRQQPVQDKGSSPSNQAGSREGKRAPQENQRQSVPENRERKDAPRNERVAPPVEQRQQREEMQRAPKENKQQATPADRPRQEVAPSRNERQAPQEPRKRNDVQQAPQENKHETAPVTRENKDMQQQRPPADNRRPEPAPNQKGQGGGSQISQGQNHQQMERVQPHQQMESRGHGQKK